MINNTFIRRCAALLALSLLCALAGCGASSSAPAQPAAPAPAEEAPAAPADETPETPDEGAAEMTYMSPDGWQIRYNAKTAEAIEVNAHTAQFALLERSAGANMLTVSVLSDVEPEEALYIVTSTWGEPDEIERREAFLPGTTDKWGYGRTYTDPEGSCTQTAIAGEYNGGVLLFEVVSHLSGDDAIDFPVSDTLAEILDSVTYTDFAPQQQYAYVPGVYSRQQENGEFISVELRADHSGTLNIHESTEITWGSTELTTDSGVKYAYTVEGDTLYLEDGGEWLDFEREKMPEDAYVMKTDFTGCDTFTQIVDRLAPGSGYANVTLGETDVLLVAPDVYALDGEEPFATEAELFIYENGTPAFLGHVASGGTANPLMLSGGKLYTAGHHFVESATLSGGTSLLTLRVSETFDADGNVRYSAESSDGTGSVSEDATLFEELWAAYGESEIIAFNEVK